MDTGPYALQARIAAYHATAPSAEETDWAAIAGYYDELAAMAASPVVELNLAVAHGYAYGSAAGVAVLARARAGGALDGYPLALTAEADLTANGGDPHRAAALFRKAAALTPDPGQRRALLRRADALAPLR